MAKLINLGDLPYRVRSAEAAERAKWPTRAMALDAATYEIVMAQGCYGGAYAPTIGFVLTREAADALAERLTYLPGGTCHHRLSYQECSSSDALGEYLEAIARGDDAEHALSAYKAQR